jgi:hypothetical protein
MTWQNCQEEMILLYACNHGGAMSFMAHLLCREVKADHHSLHFFALREGNGFGAKIGLRDRTCGPTY